MSVFMLAGVFGGILASLSSCGHKFNKECESIEEEIQQVKKDNPQKITLSAFVENSGSIDGYVNGMSKFKTDFYSFVSNSVIDKYELYYINQELLKQDVGARDFIMDLTPASFKLKGGNRASSDIAAVLAKALEGAKKNVCLLESDFIFSPDKEHRSNVSEYFAMQTNDVKNTILKQMKSCKDMCVVVYKGVSTFDGFYYNKEDAPTKINEPRPFYILMAGDRSSVAKIFSETNGTNSLKEYYTECFPVSVCYEISNDNTDKVGKFSFCRSCKKRSARHIVKCEEGKRDAGFQFAVKMDLSKLPLDDTYLTDVTNYSIKGGAFKISKIEKIDDKDFSHKMTITANGKLANTIIEISLDKKYPTWIAKSNDSVGDSAVPGKTFGIEPMMNGIKAAFAKQDMNYYTKIKVLLEI